jgi:hypothetical protein
VIEDPEPLIGPDKSRSVIPTTRRQFGSDH